MLEGKKGIAAEKAAKGHLCGMMVFEFLSPNMPAIAASAGADFLMYDMEHAGAGIETLRVQMAACRGLGIAPLVRVPSVEGNTVGRVLDAGAHGVMVPMVESAAQAADIVERACYPPKGRRGTAFSIAHDDFAAGRPVDKMEAANDRTIVIAMVETAAGLDNVEAIAATPGVDALWLGHFDLTSSMGIPGELDNPAYVEAVVRISAAAAANGKPAGYMAADREFAEHYWNQGYRMLAYGLDHLLLKSALAEGVEFVGRLAEGGGP